MSSWEEPVPSFLQDGRHTPSSVEPQTVHIIEISTCVSPCHGWPLSAVGQRCCESVTNESTGRCSGSPPLLVVLLPVSTVTAATIVGQWQDRASSGKWVSER